MKLTINGAAENSPEKIKEHLRTLIKNSGSSSNVLLSNENKKPLREQFSGINQDFRHLLLSYYNLPESTSDIVLMDNLDNLFDTINRVNQVKNEQSLLKHQLAALMVGEAVRSGVLKKEESEAYIRLAASDFDTTKEIIYGNHQNRLELNELMKLSGHELYMTDKLERLKELNEDCFKLKLKEAEKYDHRNTNGDRIKSNVSSNEDNSPALTEVEELMKLSADQLYYEEGKMERLKDLNFNHFKLMYKELFKVEYLG